MAPCIALLISFQVTRQCDITEQNAHEQCHCVIKT